VKKLNFKKVFLKQNLAEAADLILLDKKHLDNNPKEVSKNDLISLLGNINDGSVLAKI
jgi:succinate semialdehyde reductase